MTIGTITKATITRYRDTGQTMVRVDWIDLQGKAGATIGNARATNGTLAACWGDHMGALLARAICHGITIDRETI